MEKRKKPIRIKEGNVDGFCDPYLANVGKVKGPYAVVESMSGKKLFIDSTDDGEVVIREA